MKVRIKLAINGEGKWCACGSYNAKKIFPDNALYENALYEVVFSEGASAAYWITAEVPVPQISEIAADKIEHTIPEGQS